MSMDGQSLSELDPPIASKLFEWELVNDRFMIDSMNNDNVRKHPAYEDLIEQYCQLKRTLKRIHGRRLAQ